MHFRGYGAAETRSAALRARTLIEQAQERGEAPEDPLLLFSVLYSFWVANFNAFDGNIAPELAAQFLKLAEEQRTDAPLMLGHRLVGVSLTTIGKVSEAQTHLDRVVALYDPVKHRQLAARFGQDIRVATLCYRSWVRWMLGYPEASLIDADMAIREAREVGQGIPLMYALYFTSWARIHCGEYAIANEQLDELVSMATQKNASQWRGGGMMHRGWIQALTGKPSDAISTITAGIAAWQSSGSIVFVPWYFSRLAKIYAEQGQFDDACRYVDQALTAVEATGETWCESDIHRTAGEIALRAPQPDPPKAETHFTRALMIARAQQAKSWELRAAMSMARLWRDQGERDKARELLSPIYSWFTEGFLTRDLVETKALLIELQ
jgi:predicted ATPase